MNLKNNIRTEKIKINGEDVTVSSYLSTIEKNSLIEVSLANSISNSTGNLQRLVYDASIYALIILKYTDIQLEEVENKTLCDVYDLFHTNNVIPKVLQAIKALNSSEIDTLLKYADAAYDYVVEKMNSSANGIQTIVAALLEMGEESMNELETSSLKKDTTSK